MNLEVSDIFINWMARTELIFNREMDRLNIGESRELRQSLKHQVMERSKAILEGEIYFLVRGRFVDMGAGRGSRVIETREGNSRLLAGSRRRPKKWYSRAFYGRLNDLQGVLGYRMMESAVNSIKDPMKALSSGNIGRPKL